MLFCKMNYKYKKSEDSNKKCKTCLQKEDGSHYCKFQPKIIKSDHICNKYKMFPTKNDLLRLINNE